MSFFRSEKKSPDTTSLEEKIFLAVLSGIISRHGALDSDGNPAIAWVQVAREFAKGAT